MKTIIKLNASALVRGRCNLRLKRTVIDGYTEQLPWNDTLYGSAFHEFIRSMYVEKDFAKSILAAQAILNRPCNIREGKQHLNENHLIKTCIDYWGYHQKEGQFDVFCLNDSPMTEIYFENLFYEDDNYIVYLVGTIDSFGKILNGIYCIRDFKTHSLWATGKNGFKFQDALINKFLEKFMMSLQLRFYVYNLRLYANKFPDTELYKIANSTIGMFIEGVFLSSTQPTLFRRSDIWTMKKNEMIELDNLLLNRVKDFVKYLNENSSLRDGLATGACSDGLFPCEFYNVCAVNNPDIQNMMLKNNFIQKPYEPKEFGK